MKKYIFTLIAVLLLSSAAFGVASNRVYYHIGIMDQWGELVTSPAITQVDVQNESGTAVAVYSTKFGTTEVGSTGVITTGLSDGMTEFWYADTAIDLTVTDGTRTYEIESFSVRTSRFMLPSFLKAVSSSNFGQTDDLDFTYGSWILDGDTTNRLDMIPDNDGAVLGIGDGTTQADVYMYSGSTASYWLFDEGAGEVYYQTLDLQLDDDAFVILGDDDDVTLQFDGTNLELFAAAIDTPFALGGVTYGFDLTYYFETAGQFRSDYDADFINLTDDMELRFGTGASSDGDIKISSNSSNVLEIEQVVLDTGTIQIGVDNRDIPIKWFAETASSYFQLTGDDVNIEAMNLALGDGDAILLGDALGTGDFTISSTSAVLTIAQVSADTGTITIGAAGTDIPITWNAETSGAELTATGDLWTFDGIDIVMNDSDMIVFGDSSDFTLTSGSATALTMDSLLTDETAQFLLGSDTEGIDLMLYGATTSEYLHWDASLDYLHLVGDKALFTLTGTTLPFHVNVTGTVAGSAITLETTDGGFTAQIDGAANGDYTLNVGDEYILNVTGGISVDSAEAAADAIGLVASDSAGGITLTAGTAGIYCTGDILKGYVMEVESVIANKSVGATESGEVFMVGVSSGAAADIVLTLPTAAAGYIYHVVDANETAVADVTITAASGDKIDDGSAAASVVHDTDADNFASITLLAIDATNWVTITSTGTWAAE